MKKSQITGFLLTLLFGPIGLFYSSVAAALGFIIAAIALGVATGGIGALLIWPVSIIVGIYTVGNYNAKVNMENKRHREILEATRHDREEK